MRPEEWERVLIPATGRVWRRLSTFSRRADRGRSVGVGAAGDRTLFADKLAEDELLKVLDRAGGVRVLSEEAGFVGDGDAKTMAVVDPLDGSSNFSRGVPFYCTAVAIVEGDGAEGIVAGVVRDLVTGEVYSASKGHGAKKNGRPIRTSGTRKLADAVVGVDLSKGGLGMVQRLAPLLAGVKRHLHFGANALELCYTAEGKTDAFVDIRGRIRITDLAAAYLIASEAGAVITGPEGGEVAPTFDLSHRLSFVASSNPDLHKQILEVISEPGGG
ncbi:MAG: D-fructose 1,6-bisphosphatase [Nitrososphaerota archaeon]|nr:D-fructose 1,6-bisphosphatase [Nitrososphaerota archaeon]